MARTCLFCGNAPVTKEHVVPRWLYTSLNARGDVTLWSGDQRLRSAPMFDITVNGVCHDCNSGWLSDVEASFRDWFQAPTRGFARILTPDDQRTVSTWALKTWLLLEHAMKHDRGGGFAPEELFDYVARFRQPPSICDIWVGVVPPGSDTMAWLASHQVLPSDSNRPVGYLAHLLIGYVVFQINVQISNPQAPAGLQAWRIGMAPPWSEAWVSVWPASNHPLSWPPSVRLTLDDIQRKFPPKQPIRLTERPAGS